MHKMRDYDGNADNDMELQEIIKMHLARAQNPAPEAHLSQIFRCDQATYDALDGETGIKKELMKNDIEVREVRDDLKVEASDWSQNWCTKSAMAISLSFLPSRFWLCSNTRT
jgi:hypothetical protein